MIQSPSNQLRSLFVFASCVTSFVFASVTAADWPQWRGPNRDGHAAPQQLLQQWPEGGPKLKWSYSEAGRGYSAVSVVGTRVFTMGSDDTDCYAICIDAATGAQLWRTRVSRASTGDDYNHGWGGGPRSTPTTDGDQVFVLTDIGVLAALDQGQGELRWSVDLVKEFGGGIPVWGYSESPLVDGDRVVVTPGGSQFMVAVDRQTGKKVWSSRGVDAPAQYVSVMRGNVGANGYYVTASKPGLFAFDVRSGDKVFSDETTGNTVAVIPTPIVTNDKVYHTSDYGAGNTLLQIEADGSGLNATTIYALSDKTMQNHHGGVVLVDNIIYGFTKANGGVWMAQDFASGETLWEQKLRPNRSGSICHGDGRLYCYNDEEGTVFLVEPDRQEWIARGELQLPRETQLSRGQGAIWAHPVIANQMLIIRDQDLLFAFDIAR